MNSNTSYGFVKCDILPHSGDLTLLVALQARYLWCILFFCSVERTHQWITTVIIITNTLLRRWPLAGWWPLMRVWSEPVYLGPQQHTSPASHYVVAKQQNSVAAFELTARILMSVHGVLAKPQQPTAMLQASRLEILKKKKKKRKKCPTQSLEASRIREALEKYVSQSREVGGEWRMSIKYLVIYKFLFVWEAKLLLPGSFSLNSLLCLSCTDAAEQPLLLISLWCSPQALSLHRLFGSPVMSLWSSVFLK